MHTYATADSIQPNITVSSEVKDNRVLTEPIYGKNGMNFLANPIAHSHG